MKRETPARPPIIAGLARANKNDIDKAWEAVQGAVRPRIHTFLATSEIHMQHKLRMSPNEVLETVGDMVQYARAVSVTTSSSARRTRAAAIPRFLVEVLSVAIRAGATTLNIPDTVGYTTPEEFGELIRHLRENVRGRQGCYFQRSLPQTIWGWRRPTRSPACRTAPGKSRSRSTGSANGPAIPAWKRR